MFAVRAMEAIQECSPGHVFVNQELLFVYNAVAKKRNKIAVPQVG